MSLEKLIKGKTVNFGLASENYLNLRPGLPQSFYKRIFNIISNEFQNTQNLSFLDVGTGPGTIAFELAKYYPNSKIKAIDISPNQIKTANFHKSKLNQNIQNNLDFRVCDVSDMNFIKDNSIDIIIGGTCFHWFDPKKTYPELYRVLSNNGLLIIVNYGYLADHLLVSKTDKLIYSYNKKDLPYKYPYGMYYMYPKYINDMITIGKLKLFEGFIYDNNNQLFNKQTWMGRISTHSGTHVLYNNKIKLNEFNSKLSNIIDDYIKNYNNSNEMFAIPHRIWCVIGQKKLSKL